MQRGYISFRAPDSQGIVPISTKAWEALPPCGLSAAATCVIPPPLRLLPPNNFTALSAGMTLCFLPQVIPTWRWVQASRSNSTKRHFSGSAPPLELWVP